MNYSNLTDEELIELLRNESKDAFEEIYNRYWARLYSSAYKRVKRYEVAEELVQDLFTGLWINRKEVNIRSTVSSYLQTAIRYMVFNHFDKEYVRRDYQEKLTFSRNFDNSTEEAVLLKDLETVLENEVSLLPAQCRSVYKLSRKEHKTNKEIALLMGISEKTVENHLTKALKRLRGNLSLIRVLLFFFTV
jgi:RNA polymerase sigma-70 factor (ECF subfamily)